MCCWSAAVAAVLVHRVVRQQAQVVVVALVRLLDLLARRRFI